MFCLNISGKWVPLYHMYSVYPGEDKGCERVDNVIIVNYVGSGVHGLVNSLLCFSQERYLRPITYSVFQWADPTPSSHTKHRPTNPQTIKFLSHFWVFGVFRQSFKKFAPCRNLAGKYQREDYYRDFCCKYCRTLLMNMQPICLRLLTMNLVTAGREYCPQLTYNSSQ